MRAGERPRPVPGGGLPRSGRIHRPGGSSPIEVVLGRLDGVRARGDRRVARCPAHEDRRPSLSVGVGRDSRVLLHCFAGCTVVEIVAAMGLRIEDLFVGGPGRGRGSQHERLL
jgi:hypothetical protein